MAFRCAVNTQNQFKEQMISMWSNTATNYGYDLATTTVNHGGIPYHRDFFLVTVLRPRLADVMPWLFDFDEPWKAPVHYPPAPWKTKGRSAIVKKNLTTYKQPIAKSGFKRGQRN